MSRTHLVSFLKILQAPAIDNNGMSLLNQQCICSATQRFRSCNQLTSAKYKNKEENIREEEKGSYSPQGLEQDINLLKLTEANWIAETIIKKNP